MNFFQSFDIAASGMSAEHFRMNTISNNIANANTNKTEDGTPYRRQVAVVSSEQANQFENEFSLASFDADFDFGSANGSNYSGNVAQVQGVQEDESDFRWVYDPSHPEAVKEGPRKGYVAMPNVNMIQEMTSMMQASRSFEANASTIQAAKSMAMKALEIGRG